MQVLVPHAGRHKFQGQRDALVVIAIPDTYYTLTLVDRTGKATTTHGRLNLTYVKQGGLWRVVDQHGSVMPTQ